MAKIDDHNLTNYFVKYRGKRLYKVVVNSTAIDV